jgi:hypothetical protein
VCDLQILIQSFIPQTRLSISFKPTTNPDEDHIEFVDDSEIPMDSFEEIKDFETSKRLEQE